MPLVEIVPHPKTAPEVTERTKEFFSSLGKYPVVVRQEIPGFVANRLQAALTMEAFSLVRRGVVTPEELGRVIPLTSHSNVTMADLWKIPLLLKEWVSAGRLQAHLWHQS
jgi:3-hydroxyacyl-CoA dehydrogenase